MVPDRASSTGWTQVIDTVPANVRGTHFYSSPHRRNGTGYIQAMIVKKDRPNPDFRYQESTNDRWKTTNKELHSKPTEKKYDDSHMKLRTEFRKTYDHRFQTLV